MFLILSIGIFQFLEKFLHASTLDLAADSNYGIAVSGPELAVGVNEAIIPKLMVKLDVRAFRMCKINKRANEFFLIHSQNPFPKVLAVCLNHPLFCLRSKYNNYSGSWQWVFSKKLNSLLHFL